MLSDKVYNVLKTIAQYVLPATATLYFGLAKIWNLPYPEQIVGTIMALDTFLGAILGLSLVEYNRRETQTTRYMQPSMPGLEASESKTVFTISTSVYDIYSWVVKVVLPGIATLYFALALIWQLPYSEQIVGTIALVDTFLGVFLGISTNQYNKTIQQVPV